MRRFVLVGLCVAAWGCGVPNPDLMPGGGGGTGGEDGLGGGGGNGGGGGGGGAGGGGGGTMTRSGGGAVGDPCMADSDCKGQGAVCITDQQGWPNGYCIIENCDADSCPAGSECFQFTDGSSGCLKTCADKPECRGEYACHPAGACIPGCTPSDCDAGEVCGASGLCEAAPCTPGSCPMGLVCTNGQCVPDLQGGPGAGPGPSCTLPTRDCVGAGCGTISQFLPVMGPGYDNYPLNGETLQDQYRSYARQDLQMLVKYAAAYVDCKAAGWNTGNGKPIGLGDMSEANGAIPGTRDNDPGHPAGTHVNGFDMDIAYPQVTSPNNYLRPICPHTSGAQDQYHCTAPPNNLDVWRAALFLGAFFTSSRIRVIGVDGKVGPLVEQAMQVLCANQWLPQAACTNAKSRLAYETTDTGRGWYYFHHHHLHVSISAPAPSPSFAPLADGCLGPGCTDLTAAIDRLRHLRPAGHGFVLDDSQPLPKLKIRR